MLLPGPLPCMPSRNLALIGTLSAAARVTTSIPVLVQVFHAAGAPIEWDEQYVAKEVDPRTNSFVTRENLDSVLVRPPALPL